ncbi:glutamate synthase domain-containing protein 2 [Aquimarina sp. EL_43]|uniref:glutamate synthase-related protein n=1 Tax=unclassified Aquimarina TaxID=2627091 RepID=UPI0018C9B6D3|nr:MULTISPECIES: glutamate synthase-related protein [unclassified Aquimarina]MBG6130064.1 glutamate synthase domain-containing protein 2 [Aquimarina sp. EL_35]MBG6148844.1 glutamate synthase domain-containing protein 2 [Aquimarina sp. EL_32]MBG6168782.1 glutamate synthase domain-containing protein 2 [Aquimarina sp. EL_43]
MKQPILIAQLSNLENKEPAHALVNGLDLVIVKYDDEISVLYGRCLHRGALMADGHIDGHNLICGVHGWDYRYDTGVSEYNNSEVLHKFSTKTEGDNLYVDEIEINSYITDHPQPFNREEYLGAYADTHPEETEPYTGYIKELAKNGLKNLGHHGFSASMGVDRNTLPKWNDIQFLPAQLANRPLLDHEEVATKVIIGPNAQKPLSIDIPLFVSDMSFGALSREAKIALSRGAEMAGTGICSGEGGMLPQEQESNTKYFYELASAQFGFSWDKLDKVQAFHFKGGQGAKTGTGGHLPGSKVSKEIAEVRGLREGQTAISPATFPDFHGVQDFKAFADQVRERTGGIPVGFKIAASHIEKDIQFALDVGVDYIILDGRGGGTGSAPTILRDNINVPTIPALARARKYLDKVGANDVTLIITGGLRIAEDFAKAMMLGADAIAVSNSALQAIGCLGMRACGSNNCPVGIATQKESLRSRMIIESSAKQLHNYFDATNDLIKVIARACGYDDISKFNHNDLSTFDHDIHRLAGINYAGVM